MTWRDLINDMKLYAFMLGLVSLASLLYGLVRWDMTSVVWGGGGIVVACCGYGVLTRWEEKRG